jgi:hypothetical protein
VNTVERPEFTVVMTRNAALALTDLRLAWPLMLALIPRASRQSPASRSGIIMCPPEVNQVNRTLRRSNLEVVALHHHMLGEEPRIIDTLVGRPQVPTTPETTALYPATRARRGAEARNSHVAPGGSRAYSSRRLPRRGGSCHSCSRQGSRGRSCCSRSRQSSWAA